MFNGCPNALRRRALLPQWRRLLEGAVGPNPSSGFSGPNAAGALPLVNQIQTMTMASTVKLWRTCIRYLADEGQKDRWEASRRIVAALNAEWARRQNDLLDDAAYFEWPDIDAAGRDSSLTGGWLEEGLLGFMGYHVGTTKGISTNQRRRILVEVFQGVVPPVFPLSYVESWNTPGSSYRLKKMAETLASFVRNAKRRRESRLEIAINHWASDLDYLYHEYYVGKFHFAWPRTGE